jgi:hypothetical protein
MTVVPTGNRHTFEQLYDLSQRGAKTPVAAEARGGYQSNHQPHRSNRFRRSLAIEAV